MYDRSVHCTQRKITQRWDKFLKENRIAGIDSDVYPDSLLNMLQPLVQDGTITQQHSDDLIDLMRTLTAENNIVLEAVGGPEKDPRMYSPQATWEINSVVDSLGLSTENRAALDAVLNQWAKLNSVRFHPDPAPEALPTSALPPIAPPIGTDDEVPPEGPEITPTAGPDDEVPAGPDDEGAGEEKGETEEEPEEEVDPEVLSTYESVKSLASDWGEKLPTIDQTKATLDAISLLGLTGKGEVLATPATLASLIVNIGTRDWDDALIDVVSLLPVAGKAFRLSAKGAKAAKALKHADRAAKIAKSVKVGKAAKNVAQNIGTIMGSRLDREDLKKVTKIRDFLERLDQSGIFGEAPQELTGKFTEMMDAARKAQPEKEKELPPLPPEATSKAFGSQRYGGLAEDVERLQTLAGIKKRIL